MVNRIPTTACHISPGTTIKIDAVSRARRLWHTVVLQLFKGRLKRVAFFNFASFNELILKKCCPSGHWQNYHHFSLLLLLIKSSWVRATFFSLSQQLWNVIFKNPSAFKMIGPPFVFYKKETHSETKRNTTNHHLIFWWCTYWFVVKSIEWDFFLCLAFR